MAARSPGGEGGPPGVRASVPWCVALHALGHAGKLLGGGIGLVARLPFGGGQAVDHFTRGSLVQRRTSIHDPVRQAIAAKAGKTHELDVLRVVPMAQVPDKAAERGGGYSIGKCIEGIGR